MKCYYCDTEFQGYKCPKCLAVYTVDEKENESGIDEEDSLKEGIKIENMDIKDEGKFKTEGKSQSKKKGLELVIDIAGEIVEAIIENIFN